MAGLRRAAASGLHPGLRGRSVRLQLAGRAVRGLIPDIAPPEQRGSASGWMAVMQAVGTVLGAFSAGYLIVKAGFGSIYGLIAALFFHVGPDVVARWETPESQIRSLSACRLSALVLADPRKYRDFYWVLLTRGMVTMGMYSVYTFFQYFLGDVIKVPRIRGSRLGS